MAESLTILLAGGGTGGHLYPGIAVAEALRHILPDAECVFLCTERAIDRTILEPTGFQFITQPIVPPLKTLGGLLKFWKSWRETKDLVKRAVREHQPAAILGLGGYAAGVAVRLASDRKIPAALLNPDVIPGKANQFLMDRVSAVCCQFEQSRQYIAPPHQGKVRVTGCPIRRDIHHRPRREESAERLGLNPLVKTLVVTGASQGAKTVNEAALEALPGLTLQGWQILHLSGKEHAPAVRKAYREAEIEAQVVDFTPAMADVWSVADLAISRAGASSVAELCVCGVPSILMPYPFHKDMHQRANAQVLADAGAAILLDDTAGAKSNAAQLKPALESLLHDGDRRAAMASAALALARPDAADAVARVLAELARRQSSQA
jgi:UDP-N-acetylglucosamine--N-acetylmuramyl-(pentapeptide) pyrophosphoryl-undecaprenol N-acetylglucosamine transferase